ncbi:hypothetical protein WJX84_002738 [Apatococcus fuscideae]|uniref:Sphingomyelin phosphodiesterase 4 n=1 Tax=Apatococcus fuscideae TaxID=2026836 RepID=A0AAW1SXH3_9CHLO
MDTSITGLLGLLEGQLKITIAQACQAIDSCLDANRDNLRGFFVQCFPALLKQLFGYDGSSWLTTASKNQNDQDAKAIISLLAPDGRLLRAMYSADMDSLVMFNFPLERLPTYTQVLLDSDAGRQAARQWPQYQQSLRLDSSGKPQLHLGVMLYFFFWTAFFVLRGTQAAFAPMPAQGTSGQARGGVSGWTHRAPLRSKTRRGAGPFGNEIYLQLLRLYLDGFLPQDPDAGRGPRAVLGQALLSIMVEFWLVDSEAPQPGAAAAAAAAAAQHQQQQARGMRSLLSSSLLRAQKFEPPPTELMDALSLLARYIAAVEDPSKPGSSPRSAQALQSSWVPWTPVQPLLSSKAGKAVGASFQLGAAGQPPAQAFACHLYRFLRRGLTMWPHQRSITPLVTLYLSYATPWVPQDAGSARVSFSVAAARPSADTSRHLAKQVSGLFAQAFGEHSPSGKGGQQQPQQAATFELDEWQVHVLANMPFFSLLLPLLLDLEASRLAAGSRPDSQDLLKALSVFPAAPDLVSMLTEVETAYNAMIHQQAGWMDSPYAEFIPFMSEQARDWESAAVADTSSSSHSQGSAAAVPSFRLFDRGPQGASARLQQIQATAPRSGPTPDEAFQRAMAMGRAFLPATGERGPGASAEGPASGGPPSPPQPFGGSQGLKLGHPSQVRYKGDSMQRPIASNEIGWLVRLLVWVSTSLNQALQLGSADTGSADAPELLGVLSQASTSLVPLDHQQELAHIEQQLSSFPTSR